MRPSVVSLVRSGVSEGPEPVPDGSERMVFYEQTTRETEKAKEQKQTSRRDS